MGGGEKMRFFYDGQPQELCPGDLGFEDCPAAEELTETTKHEYPGDMMTATLGMRFLFHPVYVKEVCRHCGMECTLGIELEGAHQRTGFSRMFCRPLVDMPPEAAQELGDKSTTEPPEPA